MKALVLQASEVQAFCFARQWRFCFIGGLALQRWGEARLTRDVDLTLLTGFGEEESYLDARRRSTFSIAWQSCATASPHPESTPLGAILPKCPGQTAKALTFLFSFAPRI